MQGCISVMFVLIWFTSYMQILFKKLRQFWPPAEGDINIRNKFLVNDVCDELVIVSEFDGIKKLHAILHHTPCNWDDVPIEECESRFISLVLVRQSGTRVNLKLSSLTETYYVVGNRITPVFIRHLLKKEFNGLHPGPYHLEYMDHNVQCGNISDSQEIVIHKTGYSIQKYKSFFESSNLLTSQEYVEAEKEKDESEKEKEKDESEKEKDESENVVPDDNKTKNQ